MPFGNRSLARRSDIDILARIIASPVATPSFETSTLAVLCSWVVFSRVSTSALNSWLPMRSFARGGVVLGMYEMHTEEPQ